MALYWRIQSLPELNHLTDEQRQALAATGIFRKARRGLITAGIWVALPLTGLCNALFQKWLVTPELSWIALTSAFILGFVVGYQFFLRRVRIDIREAIVEAYRGERLPVCLKCGYPLEGIEGGKCPECGHGIMVKTKPETEAHPDVSDSQ